MFKKRVLPVLLSLALTATAALPVVYAVESSGEAEAEQPVPQTVNFTNAGPFLPVTLAEEEEEQDALQLDKKVTANNDGSYKITMEAYTTGTVTTTTSTKPVDIVLVLDQSGSMADVFDRQTRQAAMKAAVNNFIDAVNEKYNAEESDHRMALVEFSDNAQTISEWKFVDNYGKNQLHAVINKLPPYPSGATRIDEGMSKAKSLMNEDYNYDGDNNDRQKVVVLFTDGVPTSYSEFDVEVANSAITSALNLKNDDVTVYSVGIFQGANPEQLYGDSGFNTNSDGTVGSSWKNRRILFWGDLAGVDVPAGNRFLNYLSSNYANASSIGLKKESWDIIVYGETEYTILENFDRTTDDDYYLTAGDSDSLDEIFETISDNISTSTVDLDERTQIIDTVTPYFDMPANKAEIKLYTQQAGPGGSFESTRPVEVTDGSITAAMDGQKVTVTGFNFNEEFVTEEEKEPGSGDYGSKLIIEFNVTPTDGFFGGNNVPTNEPDSGVYAPDAAEPTGTFDVPRANVPIKYAINGKDQTIFLGEDADLADTIEYVENYQPNEWNNSFVTIQYTLSDSTGIVLGTYTIDKGAATGAWQWNSGVDSTPALTAPQNEYTLTCTVTPDVALDSSVGKPQEVNNFRPESNQPTVFVQSGTLTITKKMAAGTTADDGERFVFTIQKDGQDYMTIALGENDSKMIQNLPKGKYTVKEDTSWSWRFESQLNNGTVTIDAENPTADVTCTNSRENEQWLNKYDWAVNHQKGGGSVESTGGSEA